MRQLTIGTGSHTATVSALALGTVPFGTSLKDDACFAILDRFADAGGTLIDTANEYAYWAAGAAGGESEEVIGRWLASRGARDRMVLSTKVGALPAANGAPEGLSKPAIKAGAAASLRRLGTDHIDIYWAHDEDRGTPLEETVEAFGELVAGGTVGVLGVSNHAMWRVEQARCLARAAGVAGFSVLQYRYSYLQPRPGAPLPDAGRLCHATIEHLDLVQSSPGMALFAYTALLKGAYTRPDKPVPEAYDHPGTTRRLAALRAVAEQTGATANQVVLSWLMGGSTPIIPIVGVSSLAQLDEVLAAGELTLDAEQRARLDAAS